jgi:HD superfamily phosphohydrolase
LSTLKIINDPVHGFINIPDGLLMDIVNHPYFQRLRRIQQMGLASYIYPGAVHTRFHHAIGAMHLMHEALEVLKSKGITISAHEQESAMAAILLHDIGHGAFSHTLEHTLLPGVHHEEISLVLMKKLNAHFEGKLETAITIFSNTYERKFFHQLVSGQLDTDRLDYLVRDSFYSGVAEGIIGYDRILKMLNVHDDRLVVEEKGIYSIEKFLVSRRLMYWQVYLHKTSLAADFMLHNILKIAKELFRAGNMTMEISPSLSYFFSKDFSIQNFEDNDSCISNFIATDDTDIWVAIKYWSKSSDNILSNLCGRLLNRNLFKVRFDKQEIIDNAYEKLKSQYGYKYRYYLKKDKAVNHAYIQEKDDIIIAMKDGRLLPIHEISDIQTIDALSEKVVKHYICYGL